MNAGCLGDETIAAMLEGALADEAARRARLHVSECDACRRLVSATIDASTSRGGAAGEPVHIQRGGPRVGTVIAGKYQIEHMLGEGGMGRVFAARQLGLARPVALKILRSELAIHGVALQRFLREACMVAALTNEHVVRVHDLGALDTGEPYLVMELLDGEDLGAVVARGPVPIEQAIAWTIATCEALGEAHALGMIHRDIKPSNLFVTRSGRLVVLDFGLAKLVGPGSRAEMTAAGVILGSPRYMAPEQITGARGVDARADIWSLGATLYHLVMGKPPFAADTLEALLASILVSEPPPLERVSPVVANAIRRALARDPAQRFSSVGELAAALQPAPLVMRSDVPSPSRTPLIALGVVIGLGVALVVGALALRSRGAAIAGEVPGGGGGVNSAAPGEAAGSSKPDPWGETAALPAPRVETAALPAPRVETAAPPAQRAEQATGQLANLDETRLRARLENIGWTVEQVTRETFPGCDHTTLVIATAEVHNANAMLFDCQSQVVAASEVARLQRGMPSAWVVGDGPRVLMTWLPTEAASKRLFDAIVVP